ncbi:MAG: type III secretion system chaperone [Kiritimatiellae bacterium]|nr:type III secretion system chaperone [Kiritimatiellia bacterium]
MNDFAEKIGLPPPETAAGAVVIDFNGIPVSFIDDAPGRAIILHAAIGEAPAGAEGERARRMLEANAVLREKAGAILCQDPETKAFAAIRTIPLQLADPDALLEAVGDLVKTAAPWR